MLPVQYQIPAAIVLLLGGAVACFFGYRLFRIVLAIFGFIFGSLLASSIFGAGDTAPMVAAAIVGGLLGAGVLIAAYFVGVALVGAGLGVLIANLAFTAGDSQPHFLVIVFAAVAGAVGSVYLQRYFIIVGTSFGGAWTLIVGAMALVGNPRALNAAASGNVWVAYPLDPAPGEQWVPITWILLGLTGVGVQMGVTGGERGRVGRRRKRKPEA
jgi:Domain of unknown function (DUF4203)